MIEPARQATDDNIVRFMRTAWWVTKTPDTRSEFEILIDFPRQQWLRERASVLRLYVHCFSYVSGDGWDSRVAKYGGRRSVGAFVCS
jgi:hypothetical protein